MMATPCNRYMEMQVRTAPAENLVLMLYDGALRFARQAQVDLAEGRMQDAHNNLTRAQDILGELMGSLNMDAGDIAHNLFKLYEFIQYRLTVANVKKSTEPIDDVIQLLGDLRATWAEAIRDARGRSVKSGGQ
ncbi:MAG TPA: flagellar export chaperone FliS [Bacillota bacterium]|jgi:flagellar protein FliS|nr:flagellar export chaperone FliS [Bacillota bacterium]